MLSNKTKENYRETECWIPIYVCILSIVDDLTPVRPCHLLQTGIRYGGW